MIGQAGLKYLDELQEVDLGYTLRPAHWGRGLATEAARACVGYGFNRLSLERIVALIDRPNGASLRVARRLGFEPAGEIVYGGAPVLRYVLGSQGARPA